MDDSPKCCEEGAARGGGATGGPQGGDDRQREDWRRDYDILWREIGRHHTRRNTWNMLFLSVNTLLLGSGIGVFGKNDPTFVLLSSSVGAVACLLWVLLNARIDVDTAVTWCQLRELERLLGKRLPDKQGVSIAQDGLDFFHGKPGDTCSLPTYLQPKAKGAPVMCRLQSVPVKTILLLLPALFWLAHAIVFGIAFCRVELSPCVRFIAEPLLAVVTLLVICSLWYWLAQRGIGKKR